MLQWAPRLLHKSREGVTVGGEGKGRGGERVRRGKGRRGDREGGEGEGRGGEREGVEVEGREKERRQG